MLDQIHNLLWTACICYSVSNTSICTCNASTCQNNGAFPLEESELISIPDGTCTLVQSSPLADLWVYLDRQTQGWAPWSPGINFCPEKDFLLKINGCHQKNTSNGIRAPIF